MKIESEAKSFLLGEKLSNGALFPVDASPLITRNDFLVKLVKDKTVLHLGCADHIELIEEKRKQGTYLHDLLAGSARDLIGADINRPALAQMEQFGIQGLYHVDDIPRSRHFNIVMVPDVIEHLGNVALFLEDLKKFSFDQVVITTPNALRLRNRLLFSAELVNTDHRYWFSPYTLAKTIYEAGFQIDHFYYTDTPVSLRRPITGLLKWMFPLCRDGLAVIISNRNG